MIGVWLLILSAIATGVFGAWLLVELLPNHHPDPREDEPHTYELAYDAQLDKLTCETWCPKCHAWKRPYMFKHWWVPECEHWPHDTTLRGGREIKRFHREQKHGANADTFVIDFFNFVDRVCYGAPVRGSTEKRPQSK